MTIEYRVFQASADQKCNICHNPIGNNLAVAHAGKEQDDVVDLHPTHLKCIELWYQTKQTCPQCLEPINLDTRSFLIPDKRNSSRLDDVAKRTISNERAQGEEAVEKNIALHMAAVTKSFYNKNGHCMITHNGTPCRGQIMSINGEQLLVKVFVLSLHPKDWPIVYAKRDQIGPIETRPTNCIKDLLDFLYSIKFLITPEIRQAFEKVDRSWFCDAENPYLDEAPSIGYGVYMSTPSMQAHALELVKDKLKNAKKVLDIGSGSGFFTALLSEMTKESEAEIIGVEIIPELVARSKRTIKEHLEENLRKRITIVSGNGNLGFIENGLYDVIHAAFMFDEIPIELIKQLKIGGRLVAPVGIGRKSLYDPKLQSGKYTVIDRISEDEFRICETTVCSFVPDSSKAK